MYTETVKFLRGKGMIEPKIALILGSGLGDFADKIEDATRVPYEEIPGFPVSTVEGHSGMLVYGKIHDKQVIALQGRFHYYEGYQLDAVTYPIRIFKELGVENLIVTNAAGGVNEAFEPGDLMLITDHINLTGQNPLIGANIDAHGPRFVDMTEAYSVSGRQIARDAAEAVGLRLQEGVYTWMTGPTYETPAEIRQVRIIGGDAVGMSTVPEVIVAKHCGIEVIGISCITNKAAGMQDTQAHDDVVNVSMQVKPKFEQLMQELIQRI